MTRRLRLAVAIAAALTGIAIGFALQNWMFDNGPPTSVISAQVGGPFRLRDHEGREVTEADYRGKVQLYFFGYTNCPDICPMGLARIAEVMDALGADAAKVKPIFISVDPQRDTPAVMKSYVEHFYPGMAGLTGTAEQIAAVAKAFRVYYKVHGDPATNPNYLVDHSGFIYVMNRDGGFVGTFSPESANDAAVKLIRRAL
ncbi:MAG: SCO family protein [Alphaproteobacteria bacterium]|nr:SCO family protein [Alphaproteobacteria bacterium]